MLLEVEKIFELDALQHILNAAESDQYIAALDYSLAFDCTDPELAMFVFQHKGKPHVVAPKTHPAVCSGTFTSTAKCFPIFTAR